MSRKLLTSLIIDLIIKGVLTQNTTNTLKQSNASVRPLKKQKKEHLTMKLKSEDQNNLHLKQMKTIESVK